MFCISKVKKFNKSCIPEMTVTETKIKELGGVGLSRLIECTKLNRP
jgi:hypothetical protein